MTGINYDDLKSYLYVSEDHGKTWSTIASGLPDYRTAEKTEITWWLSKPTPVTLLLKDSTGKLLWSVKVNSQQGFNQYRWDLIVSRQNSDLPYFTQYEKYLKAGKHNMILSNGKSELVQPFIVNDRILPYKP